LPKGKILYKESVEKDLKKSDKKERIKILNKIEKELSSGLKGRN